MIKTSVVVISCLLMAGVVMAAGLPTPPSPQQRREQVLSQIKQLERELAQERIRPKALLPKDSAQCRIYGSANIAKTEQLLRLHQEARNVDVLEWRGHLAWMYENCVRGVSRPRNSPRGPTPRPEMLPQTRGLEQAYDLYKEGLMGEKPKEVALKVAEAYEDKYSETGDETLLIQASHWREKAGEQTDSIRSRHQSLEQEWFRKQPRLTPRQKIG